ncbi:hypothetical protein ACFZBE_17845 [Streptomyces sp. NPDC008061]|uniref:hypothetical protein n=1 Tax=Streptomyces sp. NPDC008061 TaxID=3364805 RepID=UPI0036EA2704
MQYTQDALFPDTEVIGTGRPHPWTPADTATPDSIEPATQTEALFGETAIKDAA